MADHKKFSSLYNTVFTPANQTKQFTPAFTPANQTKLGRYPP